MKSIIRLVMFVIVMSLLVINACGGNAENLQVGSPAPDFSIQDAYGNEITLSKFKGINPVVIYFYPKASTPGCTKQACGIRDTFNKFEESKIVVLGISVDSKEAIKEFIDDHKLNFPLLSDENKEVSKSYGVLNNIGLDSRITFIVNKEGNIASILRDVDVENHADDVYKIALNLI